jgi:hypothetical protein
MGNINKKEKVTVEALLRIKRNERPSSDFWNSFENDFERRRLHALVERETLRHSFWNPFLKAAMYGLPALLLVAVSGLWVQNSERFALEQQVVAEGAEPLEVESINLEQRSSALADVTDVNFAYSGERLSSQFVVDAIEASTSPRMNFQKVLYTPALHLAAPSGSSYVRDSLSTNNYGVTKVDLKLGRNF